MVPKHNALPADYVDFVFAYNDAPAGLLPLARFSYFCPRLEHRSYFEVVQINQRAASNSSGLSWNPNLSPMKPVSLVIIEDHAIVGGLVARVAEDAFEAVTVHSTREGYAGVELCAKEKPDIVILDLELPDADGFELVEKIREVSPETRILILSAHTESYVLHKLKAARVFGFVDKNEQSPNTLVEALRSVAEGRQFMSKSVEKAFEQLSANPNSFHKLLSEREQDLLRLFGQGLTDQAIAEQVGLKELTVRNHRRNIMSRLGIHSTPELIRYALEHGFSRVRQSGRRAEGS